MSIGRTQSDVLQQLGVSYSQLVDYSSKEYAAIIVSPTYPCPTVASDSLRLIQVQIGILVVITWDCITTLYVLPRHLSPDEVDASQSDGEMMFFWKATRQARWSPARILFMVVSSSAHRLNCAQLIEISPESPPPDHRVFPPGLLAREPIT